jgi:hypothetical protein
MPDGEEKIAAFVRVAVDAEHSGGTGRITVGDSEVEYAVGRLAALRSPEGAGIHAMPGLLRAILSAPDGPDTFVFTPDATVGAPDRSLRLNGRTLGDALRAWAPPSTAPATRAPALPHPPPGAVVLRRPLDRDVAIPDWAALLQDGAITAEGLDAEALVLVAAGQVLASIARVGPDVIVYHHDTGWIPTLEHANIAAIRFERHHATAMAAALTATAELDTDLRYLDLPNLLAVVADGERQGLLEIEFEGTDPPAWLNVVVAPGRPPLAYGPTGAVTADASTLEQIRGRRGHARLRLVDPDGARAHRAPAPATVPPRPSAPPVAQPVAQPATDAQPQPAVVQRADPPRADEGEPPIWDDLGIHTEPDPTPLTTESDPSPLAPSWESLEPAAVAPTPAAPAKPSVPLRSPRPVLPGAPLTPAGDAAPDPDLEPLRTDLIAILEANLGPYAEPAVRRARQARTLRDLQELAATLPATVKHPAARQSVQNCAAMLSDRLAQR